MRRVWLVLPDQLSIRLFFDAGIVERLRERLEGALAVVFLVPRAVGLNHRHGFHLDRMAPGHPNWMLDSSRAGPLPRWRFLEGAMERWHFSKRRHVPRRLLDA